MEEAWLAKELIFAVDTRFSGSDSGRCGPGAAGPGYKVVNTYKVGGDGGWII